MYEWWFVCLADHQFLFCSPPVFQPGRLRCCEEERLAWLSLQYTVCTRTGIKYHPWCQETIPSTRPSEEEDAEVELYLSRNYFLMILDVDNTLLHIGYRSCFWISTVKSSPGSFINGRQLFSGVLKMVLIWCNCYGPRIHDILVFEWLFFSPPSD